MLYTFMNILFSITSMSDIEDFGNDLDTDKNNMFMQSLIQHFF